MFEKLRRAPLRKTDDRVADMVVLASIAEAEHEIAVYELLVTNARARGTLDVAQLLEQDLGQERYALQLGQEAMDTIAGAGIAVAA